MELGLGPVPDGLDELVGEGVSLDVDDAVVGVLPVNLMGDGVHEVGLAQTGFSPDEQGVVPGARRLGHGPGSGVGELVGGAHHKAVEGVVLAAGEKTGIGLGVGAPLLVLLVHHLDLKVGGEELMQGLLNGGDITGGDDSPLEFRRGTEDEGILVQSHGPGVTEPRLDGGGGHIRLH